MSAVPKIRQFRPCRFSRKFTTDLFEREMDTVQIPCTLRDVRSFIDVFPSDLLPRSIARTCTLIVSADPHTDRCSHWLALHILFKSSIAYYFVSYGIVPLVPEIQAFIRRNRTTLDYNRRQLQGPTSNVRGKYCCLLALHMDRATLRNNSSRLSMPVTQTYRWSYSSLQNSRPNCRVATGVNAVNAAYYY